jgi:hypothetical protein
MTAAAIDDQPALAFHEQRFRVGQVDFSQEDESIEAILSAAYSAKQRPLCLCVGGGTPMYIAHVGDRFIVKRMPGAGHLHGAECPSFDPPGELSGLGEVAGSAIQEDLETGVTTLRLDFTLAKRGGSRPPVAAGGPADTVRTDGQKLTLRGTLHYLWEKAELSRWSPGMGGRRSWCVVQRRLLAAVQNTFAKGDPLADLLFVPEPWSQDAKDALERTRRLALGRLHTRDDSGTRLMVLIAEVKEFKGARFGVRAICKHLPEMPLKVEEDLARRIDRRFEKEIALWQGEDDTHMILVGTFGLDTAGYERLEEVSLMVTDANWIPIEHRWDLELVRRLVAERRRFTKGMRYNLAADKPIASAVLSDSAGQPVALYVIHPSSNAESVAKVDTLVEESAYRSWIWHAGGAEMPALPASSAGGAWRPARDNVL